MGSAKLTAKMMAAIVHAGESVGEGVIVGGVRLRMRRSWFSAGKLQKRVAQN